MYPSLVYWPPLNTDYHILHVLINSLFETVQLWTDKLEGYVQYFEEIKNINWITVHNSICFYYPCFIVCWVIGRQNAETRKCPLNWTRCEKFRRVNRLTEILKYTFLIIIIIIITKHKICIIIYMLYYYIYM